MKTVLVAPGNTVGAAVRHAGMAGEIFAAARRAPDVRPQGRPRNAGCPACSIEGMGMLRRARGASMCADCRREAEY